MYLKLLIEDYDNPRCPLEVVKYFHSYGVFDRDRYKSRYGEEYPHEPLSEYFWKAAHECEVFHKESDLL